MRPFLGIQRMFSTSKNLILLASNNVQVSRLESKSTSRIDGDNQSNWTIYNLKIASAGVLYRDFMELAANHIPDCPKVYAHLLSEAHMIVRIAKEVSFQSEHAINRNTANGELEEQYNQLFLDSCLKLGDVSVMYVNCTSIYNENSEFKINSISGQEIVMNTVSRIRITRWAKSTSTRCSIAFRNCWSTVVVSNQRLVPFTR